MILKNPNILSLIYRLYIVVNIYCKYEVLLGFFLDQQLCNIHSKTNTFGAWHICKRKKSFISKSLNDLDLQPLKYSRMHYIANIQRITGIYTLHNFTTWLMQFQREKAHAAAERQKSDNDMDTGSNYTHLSQHNRVSL